MDLGLQYKLIEYSKTINLYSFRAPLRKKTVCASDVFYVNDEMAGILFRKKKSYVNSISNTFFQKMQQWSLCSRRNLKPFFQNWLQKVGKLIIIIIIIIIITQTQPIGTTHICSCSNT